MNDPKEADYISKEELLDALAVAQRENDVRSGDNINYFNNRLQELEGQIADLRRSSLQQELSVIHAIGRHNSSLEGQLKVGVEDMDAFFALLPNIEQQRGFRGAYDEVLIMLRKSQTNYSLCLTELQSQKRQWSILVEKLRSQ